MNSAEMLENSHLTTIRTVEDLSDVEWDVPGVCGDWSTKDVLAHLAAHELVLFDVLSTIIGDQPAPTPYMLRFASSQDDFNDATLKARRYHTAQQVEDEYQDAQVQTSSLLMRIPAERFTQTDLFSWYRPNFTLTDFISQHCQHTQEHCAQIAHFRQKAVTNQ